jgi:hypothetical protein
LLCFDVNLISHRKEAIMERETIYINLRTKRLNILTEKIEYITNKNGEKQIHKVVDSEETLQDNYIRSQRYTKQVSKWLNLNYYFIHKKKQKLYYIYLEKSIVIK